MSNQITLTKENLNETTLIPAKATPSVWNNRSVMLISNVAGALLTAGTIAAVILGGPITLIVGLASAALLALATALKSAVARLQANRVALESQINEIEQIIKTEEKTPPQKTETLEIQTEKQTQLETINEETASETSETAESEASETEPSTETATEETIVQQKTESENNETLVNSTTQKIVVETPKETPATTKQKTKGIFASVVNFAKQHPYLLSAGALTAAGLAGYAAYGAYATAPAILNATSSQAASLPFLQQFNLNSAVCAVNNTLSNTGICPAVIPSLAQSLPISNAVSAVNSTGVCSAVIPSLAQSLPISNAVSGLNSTGVCSAEIPSTIDPMGTCRAFRHIMDYPNELAGKAKNLIVNTFTQQVTPRLHSALNTTRNLLGSYNMTHLKGAINNAASIGLNQAQKMASENSSTIVAGAAVSLALAGALAVKRNSAKAKRAALVQRIKKEQSKYKAE